jgi:hypothetical protein
MTNRRRVVAEIVGIGVVASAINCKVFSPTGLRAVPTGCGSHQEMG